MATDIIKQSNYEWIDLTNPNPEELQKIADKYDLNIYNLTDSLEPNHLPKFEIENDINFFILRIIENIPYKDIPLEDISHKIAIFYNEHIVISIHRTNIPFLNEIIEKYVKTNKASTTISLIIKILEYVFHTYNDAIVSIMDKLDSFENKLFLKNPSSDILKDIYFLKRKTNHCLKMLILSDDVINSVRPGKQEKAAYQDIKDLYVKLTTLYEQVIEDSNNLVNLYISIASQKTNEIMKTLTVFSIFFLPLSFIAGIYGMNFEYMPELNHKWGYPVVIIIMVVITGIIYYWLKRKKWM